MKDLRKFLPRATARLHCEASRAFFGQALPSHVVGPTQPRQVWCQEPAQEENVGGGTSEIKPYKIPQTDLQYHSFVAQAACFDQGLVRDYFSRQVDISLFQGQAKEIWLQQIGSLNQPAVCHMQNNVQTALPTEGFLLPSGLSTVSIEASSVKKKRRLKMNKHKQRKLRRRERHKNK